MRLKDKTAFITGGSTGIGLATAALFHAEGASVAITGRTPETLERAAAEIGPRCLAIQADQSSIADTKRALASTTERFGMVDVLMVNAGIVRQRSLNAVDESHYDELMNVNLKGVYFTVQRALPHLADTGASIILVTSTINKVGVPGFSVYSATKAAVRSLARSFAAELAPMGHRVNALSPGFVKTPIFDKAGVPEADQAEMEQYVTRMIALKRAGKPGEIARAALFLASADSSYVTGTELVAGGGLSEV